MTEPRQFTLNGGMLQQLNDNPSYMKFDEGYQCTFWQYESPPYHAA